MTKLSFIERNRNVFIFVFIEILVACSFYLYIGVISQIKPPVEPVKIVMSSPEEYLARINKERVKIDAPQITIDPTLNNTAKIKADDMIAKHYYAHDAPDGTKWYDIIRSSRKLPNALGENLAECYTDIDKTMAGWIGSPEHYKNIMDTQWKYFGSYSEINPRDGCMVVVNHFSN